MDIKELEYISSAGLRVLLSTQKVMSRQGSMVIRDASEAVKEIFGFPSTPVIFPL